MHCHLSRCSLKKFMQSVLAWLFLRLSSGKLRRNKHLLSIRRDKVTARMKISTFVYIREGTIENAFGVIPGAKNVLFDGLDIWIPVHLPMMTRSISPNHDKTSLVSDCAGTPCTIFKGDFGSTWFQLKGGLRKVFFIGRPFPPQNTLTNIRLQKYVHNKIHSELDNS